MYTLFDKDRDEPMHFNDGLRRIHRDDVVSTFTIVVKVVIFALLVINNCRHCNAARVNACVMHTHSIEELLHTSVS
jgi:hypothetical protein